jgi:hypothetical protein
LAPVDLPLDPRVDVDVLLDPSSMGRSGGGALVGKVVEEEAPSA